ncbi:MAG TPA: sigma-70 family RNA polymerase sigma factor [Puia sp.]|jgi:RNA polymerase sigma-70 factor (ECF subfamily)|uniref:RNA polymerase sigma factor n=1 Tax=Puia sp. TaxID=2045100 RepID=UPI002BF821CA|nr:sigma-70 family RNA polymerase sigma factor [Puia sp.]HVU98194.1 sigma-70 family RNA polymerase sigma factor [Puia sp.]
MASVNLLDENLLLWNKFRNGDADAFGELMRAHYQDLFNYGTRFTKDTGLVRDCIQDLFLTLWLNRLTVSETSFIKYDLLRSLRHNLTRTISRSRRAVEPQFEYLFNSPPIGGSLIREEQLADLARKMRRSLAGLSRRQQEVIYLRFHMDAYAEDIAGIMSLSGQSVQNLLNDALRRLRKVRKFIFTNVNRRL